MTEDETCRCYHGVIFTQGMDGQGLTAEWTGGNPSTEEILATYRRSSGFTNFLTRLVYRIVVNCTNPRSTILQG